MLAITSELSLKWQQWLGCNEAAMTSQQLDRARQLRGRGWKFPTGTSRVSLVGKTPHIRTAYLHAKRTVAFAENHHLTGVNKLLYPRFEFILPGVILDGRHFSGISVCLRRASFEERENINAARTLTLSKSTLSVLSPRGNNEKSGRITTLTRFFASAAALLSAAPNVSLSFLLLLH